MKKLLFLLPVLLALTACRTGQPAPPAAVPAADTLRNRYAQGFRVHPYPDHTRVEVVNPWDTAKVLRTYILVDKRRPLPDPLPAGTLVRTPLEKVAAYSSVHCGVMDALGVHKPLAGVCESRYIDIDFVKQGLKDGSIADLGEAFSPDVEKLIALAPEAIFTTPIENLSYGRVEKIGIPLIECTDYMETSPLGRTDWVRFYGLFFGREEQADSLMDRVAADYTEIRDLASRAAARPRVLTETKTGSAWYVPGGRSYAAALLRDAGADYPWSGDPHTGSVPLSPETVLEKGVDADIWILKYNRPENMTYTDFAHENPSYRNFAPYKNKRIFACNTGEAPYYEDLPTRPDLILKDLVWVFHPELLPDHTPRYFHRMEE